MASIDDGERAMANRVFRIELVAANRVHGIFVRLFARLLLSN